MMLYAVEFSEGAWDAIQAQIRYVAVKKKSPLNAGRWSTRLYLAIDTLESMPRRFAIDPLQTEVMGADVHRMVFEQTYLVFYTVNDDKRLVYVVSFRHGARDEIDDK